MSINLPLHLCPIVLIWFSHDHYSNPFCSFVFSFFHFITRSHKIFHSPSWFLVLHCVLPPNNIVCCSLQTKTGCQIVNLSLNMINFSFTVVKLKEKSRKQKSRFFNSYLWTVRISANVAFRGRTRFKIEQVFIVSSLKQKHLKVLVQMQRVKIKLSLRVSHTKQSSDWIRSGLKVFVL